MFVFPHGATVDRDGNLWVTDARGENGKGHQVFKFSPDGKVLMTLGKAGVSGSGPDAVRSADRRRRRAERRHLRHRQPSQRQEQPRRQVHEGRQVHQGVGTKGSGPGEISEPHTIAMDSRGRLFVGDRENNRIQIFDQDGKFLDEWRQFGRPSGISITTDDTIYVADSESGPDTGAHELTGIKKGIRIGSAKDGTVTAFIEDMESTTRRSFGRRRRRRRCAGQCLRRASSAARCSSATANAKSWFHNWPSVLKVTQRWRETRCVERGWPGPFGAWWRCWLLASPGVAQTTTTDSGEWRYLGGDAGHTRFSPLNQINASNFSKLKVAWVFRGDNFGPGLEFTARSTPIYVEGVLYTVVGQRRQVVAIDAATGETRWTFREPDTSRYYRSPRTDFGKGVAYAKVDGRGVIFISTPGVLPLGAGRQDRPAAGELGNDARAVEGVSRRAASST